MTANSTGFAWEGFFRSLQGNITSMLGLLLAIIVIYFIARAIIQRTAPSATEAKTVQIWANLFALIFIVLVIGGFCISALSKAAVNRMPRSDVDRTGVYDQMKQKAAPEKK